VGFQKLIKSLATNTKSQYFSQLIHIFNSLGQKILCKSMPSYYYYYLKSSICLQTYSLFNHTWIF